MQVAGDALGRQVADLYAGDWDPPALLAQFRAARLLCPTIAAGALWSAQLGDIHWLYAFTSEHHLARFAQLRGSGRERWTFVRVEGGRLLDLAVPAFGGPAGVAVDVDSPSPVMFPPVEGIVPEEAVVR